MDGPKPLAARGNSRPDSPDLEFDGERFVPGGAESEIDLEHYHRYLATTEIVRDKRVLDMACGAGYGSHILSKAASEVVGLDISQEAVTYATSRFSSPNLRYIQGDCAAPPFEDQSFDVIVSFETLEHIENHDVFLAACKRLLKPSGALIISTPERGRYNAQLAGRNAHHLRELSELEFSSALKSRFKNVRMAGQRVVFGSLIVPGRTNATRLHSIRKTPEGTDAKDAYDRSIYLLAHCSDATPPPLPAGLYEGAYPPNAVSSLLGGICERDAQIVGLRRELLEARNNVGRGPTPELSDGSIARELEAQAAMIFSLRARLGGTEDELRRANVTREHVEALLAGANAELVGRREEARRLRDDLDGVRSSRDGLNAAIASQAESMGVLEEHLAAQIEAVVAVSRDLSEHRSRLKEAERARDLQARDIASIRQDLRRDQDRLEAALARAVAAEASLVADRRRADDLEARLLRQRRETNRMYDQVRTAIRLLETGRDDLQRAISERRLAESQIGRERFVGKRAVDSIWRHVRRSPPLALPFDFLIFLKHVGLLNLRSAMRLTREAYLIRTSRAVDEVDYLARYFDLRIRGGDPVQHYLMHGANEGRDPRPDFSTSGYLAANPDVRESGINPLVHHVKFGKSENRQIRWPDLNRIAHSAFPEFRREDDASIAHSLDRASPASRQPAAADLYAVRPDDVVGAEARRGQAFMRRYDLLSQSPDFSAATKAVAAARSAIAESGMQDEGAAPRVSIIIPIYGQLAYTLNCLDSLSRHVSKHTFEIIVADDRSPDESYAHLQQVPWIRLVRNESNQGFLRTCNIAVEQARGFYVVLLNNDTRVVEGWLDELVDSYEQFPEAGLIGSKLFFEDGSLQEAGGIIWRDGSAWNYGRNDDPAKPEYCFARRVDYVSGCSISLPRSVWRDLGGFDEAFCPAYCEDSDLAMRVREAGLEVWMQPLSRVIHYEGRTSGTDLTQGVKAHQVKNSKTLFERWRHRLAGHGENGYNALRESNRTQPMRALLIDAVTPTPTMDAGSVTTSMTLQILHSLGFAPTFVPADNLLFFPPHTSALHRAGIQTAYVPFDVSFEDHMRRHGRSYDFIIVYRIGVLQMVLPLIRQYAPQAPLAFHNIDIHYLRLERQAALNGDRGLAERAKKLKVAELQALSDVDCTIVHSEVERETLRAEVKEAEITVFPYMTELVGTKIPFEERQDVMFLGGYGHAPNEDAVLHFVKNSWPQLREFLPGARFLAVGANPTEAMKALAGDDVIITGHVQDLRPYFDRCRVFVCPLRFGAGVKGKISTSMAHGLPVVSTSIGTEGMGLSPGNDVTVADDGPDFLEAVKLVYSDKARWSALAQAGITFVSENNSYGMGIRKVSEVIAASRRRHAARNRRN